MLPADLQHVGPLYREMLETTPDEEKQYPAILDIDKEVEEFTFFALGQLKKNPAFKGIVALDGKVAKGFLLGGLSFRIVGAPKKYFLGQVLYVTPKFRHLGLGERMVASICEWAVAMGAEALEVAFKPGSSSHKHWSRMGFRSYTAQAVLADKEFGPILNYPAFKEAKEDLPKTAEG
jgi:GNAT superfamily N-acetyltransferase